MAGSLDEDRDNEPSNVTISGKRLTVRELREWREKNAPKHRANFRLIAETRTPPGGHQPYWGTGHISESAGVPSSMAAEHAQWVQKQGIAGVEVRPDGTVATSSPGAREQYLKARGLQDFGSAGSGTGGQLTLNEEHRRRTAKPKPTDPEKFTEAAKKIAADPEVRAAVAPR